MEKIKLIFRTLRTERKTFLYVTLGILIFCILSSILMESVRFKGLPIEYQYEKMTPEMKRNIQIYGIYHTFTMLLTGLVGFLLLFDALKFIFSHRVGNPKVYIFIVIIIDIIGEVLLLHSILNISRADYFLFKTGHIVISPISTYLMIGLATLIVLISMALHVISDFHSHKICKYQRDNNIEIAEKYRNFRERL